MSTPSMCRKSWLPVPVCWASVMVSVRTPAASYDVVRPRLARRERPPASSVAPVTETRVVPLVIDTLALAALTDSPGTCSAGGAGQGQAGERARW